jgi:hypothetical protein
MIRGPYCTGAVTPSAACTFVWQPQLHCTVSIWYSVVTAFTGGMSMTCRRSTAVTAGLSRLIDNGRPAITSKPKLHFITSGAISR